ncbi:hypothetical protein A5836_000631, partial [Enterococcus faecium]
YKYNRCFYRKDFTNNTKIWMDCNCCVGWLENIFS